MNGGLSVGFETCYLCLFQVNSDRQEGSLLKGIFRLRRVGRWDESRGEGWGESRATPCGRAQYRWFGPSPLTALPGAPPSVYRQASVGDVRMTVPSLPYPRLHHASTAPLTISTTY